MAPEATRGPDSAAIVPVLWWSGPILAALGQEPRIALLGQEWLRVMIPAMPAVLAGMVLNSYLAALGRPNLALLVNLVGPKDGRITCSSGSGGRTGTPSARSSRWACPSG